MPPKTRKLARMMMWLGVAGCIWYVSVAAWIIVGVVRTGNYEGLGIAAFMVMGAIAMGMSAFLGWAFSRTK